MELKEIIKDTKQQEVFLRECERLIEYGKLSGIVVAAANETSSPEEAVQYVINAICLFTGWEIGHLYIRQKNEFVPTSVWFLSDKELYNKIQNLTMKTAFKGNEGFLGRVFSSQRPVWLSAFYAEPDFLRKDVLLQNGIRSAIGLPIIVRYEVVAALEFFSVKIQSFDYRLMDILAQIGVELGRAFERFLTEKELQKENIFLFLMREITTVANLARTSDEAFQQAIDKICSHTKWLVGHVYLLKRHYPDTDEILISSNIWYLENSEKFKIFKEVTEKTTFAFGIGLPGRVWADKKAHWIQDVQKDPNFPRAKIAKNIGVKGAFGFPVFSSEGKVLAVLEFFSDKEEEKDEKFLEIMANIGIQLGRVLERNELEKRLWKQISKLQRFQRITVGRELKMVELKQEIKKLKSE